MAEVPATSNETAGAAGMPAIDPEERQRADAYRLLGRLLAAPADEETLGLIAQAPVPDDDTYLSMGWRMLAASAARTSADQVEDEYTALFIGLGRGELVPYASWYLTGFLMEQPLAKLRADMDRLGFARHDGVREPEDHAAALCEIMALLAEDPEAGSLEAQADFFASHIGTWLARFFRDLQVARSARFYRAVGQFGEQFITLDQRYLGMVERTAGRPDEPAGSGIS